MIEIRFIEFNTIEESQQFIKERYTNWLNEANRLKENFDALERYAGNGYIAINEYLRTNSTNAKWDEDKTAELIQNILNYAGSIGKRIVLYRLISIEEFKEIECSSFFKPYHSKAFLSTSLTKIRARNEDNEIMLKLHAFSKTNGAPLKDVSGSYWEQEFLVNLNSKI